MEAENLWRCFLETGAPEYYLLYKAAKAEGIHQLEATNMPKLVQELAECLPDPQRSQVSVSSKQSNPEGTHVLENPGACAAGGSV